ncbi:CHAT domain-containing protein [Dactylosporangium sp. CA-052675]|uniref:CHAT domain-containing protein n=1 Tax=Dactylosporangium sp. CA-052675 TaxID=3239927 RepID=UPI003D919BE5
MSALPPAEARTEYARRLLARYARSGDPAELAHAEKVARRVVADCPADDPGRGDYLSNLAIVLRTRFDREGDPALLDECIALQEEAVRAAPPGDRNAVALLVNLAVALRVRFGHGAARDDLARAVELVRRAGPDLDGHPLREALRGAALGVLRTAAEHGRDPAVLAEAVAAARDQLAVVRDPDERRRLRLTASGLFRLRYQREGDPEDLERVVAEAGEAAAGLPDAHPDGPAVRSTLGAALVLRFRRRGDLGDLDRALPLLRAVLEQLPPGHPARASAATNLVAALQARFETGGDGADLDAMIDAGTTAAAAAPPAGPVRVAALANLASAHAARAESRDTPADLDAAVDLRRSALAAAPAPDQVAALHSGLASSLRHRYERRGDEADLDAAIASGEAAVEAARGNAAERGRALADLCAAYRTRYDRHGRHDDLEAAVRAGRAAVDATAEDDPARARRLSTLGLALLRLAGHTGSAADLDDAVDAGRRAAATTRPGDRMHARMLANLSNALRVRHERTGDLADLDESVLQARAALAATPAGDALRPRRLAALATGLLRRFEAGRRDEDIDEAIVTAEQAVAATADDHPGRPMHLANAGLMRFRRFEASGARDDLEAAIDRDRRAVLDTPDDHPDRPGYLSNLVVPLLRRHALLGAAEDLEAAVAAAGAAVADDPAAGGLLFNLGAALRARATLPGAPPADAERDRAAAAEAFRRCAGQPGTMPVIRAAAAMNEAELEAAAGRWAAADAAYAVALDLLPILAGRQLGWDSRHAHLARLGGLGPDAAAVALHRGDPLRAVAVLERARGVVLGQAAEQRRDLGELRRADPALADAFDEVCAVLNADTTPTEALVADPVTVAAAAGRRRDAAARFDDVVARIRALGLLRDPDPEDLLAAAASGTVVVVNVSRYRCDALILRPGGVEPVPLPGLRPGDVTADAAALLAATEANDWDSNPTLRRVLGRLWERIAAPVLARLNPPPGARVCWLPTGALGVLPLHAAAPDDGGPGLLDRTVSTYTATLRSLLHARDAGAAGTDPASAVAPLVVAVPHTGDLPPLRRAADEGRVVAGRLGTDDVLADAGRDAVLQRLRDADWAHFACHAVTDAADPAASALLLADRPLRVRDIGALPTRPRRLAYLSACTTALAGGLLADEALHISSIFQLTGFRHVVGTLWRVGDDAAHDLAADVYERLGAGTAPAEAVNAAAREHRDRYPRSPMLWAGLVHLGP